MKQDSHANFDLHRAARLLRYARPHRAQWGRIVVLTLAATGVALLIPWPMQVLVDHVFGTVPLPPLLARIKGSVPSDVSWAGLLIAWVVCAGVLLFLLSAVLDAVLSCAWVKVGQAMVYQLGADVFARIQRRSLIFHTRSEVGDLLSRVTGDAWCVYAIVETLLLGPARAAILTIAMVVLMWRMDWKLTLAALAAAPVMAGTTYWLSPPIRAASKLRREVEGRLLSHVQQTLSGIPVVQVFAAEGREQQRFRDIAELAIGAQKRTTLAGQFHQLGTGLVAALGSALILWIGIRQVLAGVLTFGTVLVFLAYLNVLQQQMRAFVNAWAGLQNISANVDRVSEMLDVPDDVVEAPDARPLPRARGELRFESVTFGYEPGRPVLDGISFEVPAGQKVAIVGTSGAGKSTLAGLIPRFFDPSKGRVLLDGTDLRGLRLADLRAQVALVLQEAFLFPASVAENIAYGRPGATRGQIESAARAAGADEFVRRLPEGYETVLAERGASLSGGERQRLSIARALLRDAPVLILDEPTAALDAATEAGLLEALKVLMRDRTTLVIAHRLSTVRDADQILVLERGRIVEQGTHDELAALGGAYGRLFAKQMSGRPQLVLANGSGGEANA